MSQEYDMYIREHINNIGRGFKLFEENYPKAIEGIELTLANQVMLHDE